MLEATSEGSTVLTIALGLAHTIVQPQSIRRRLNSYNFDAGLDYNFTTGSKHQKLAQLFEQKFYGLFEHLTLAFSLKASKSGSIVSTKAFCLAKTNLRRSSCLFTGYI
jgi:hypothetical protein